MQHHNNMTQIAIPGMTDEEQVEAFKVFIGTAAWHAYQFYLDVRIKEYAAKILGDNEDPDDQYRDQFDNDKKYTERDLLTLIRKELIRLQEHPEKITQSVLAQANRGGIQDQV